jgi:hypothetical protein
MSYGYHDQNHLVIGKSWYSKAGGNIFVDNNLISDLYFNHIKTNDMETKALAKSKTEWPSLFNRKGWVDRFFDLPLDASFNFSRALNIPSINVKETEHEYKLSIAARVLKRAILIFSYMRYVNDQC